MIIIKIKYNWFVFIKIIEIYNLISIYNLLYGNLREIYNLYFLLFL